MERDVETLVSYIPMDRRQALAHGTILGDRASGAVLFADISGFTPLTSMLYQQFGPQRGAEELDRILNQIFDALIGRIHQYRGSVISFSGDAITCWFDGDDGLWATACALDMQDVMANMGSIELPGGRSLPLDIKASVAAGAVRRLMVGDEEIQVTDTLAGELLLRMAEGEKVAARGEVIVCTDVARNLGGRPLITEQRTAESGLTFSLVEGLTAPVEGRPWLDVPINGLAQNSLRPWLLPPVYDRLNTGHGQFLAELRNSVALFLNFAGLDYDGDPAVGEKLDRFIRRVQDILAYYGGSLLNLTIGDKGSYLLSSFGAPVAHEDDARRAVSAALDLLTLPGKLEDIDDVRIGISQGIMFSGAYGGTNRRTYGILGEETNIAARLMDKAKTGQALVTDRVAQATNQSHSYQTLPPVAVKGIVEPIPVRRLLARRQAAGQVGATAESEMVGRSAERALLREQLLALQNGGTGGIIIIEGEAGIGKSRLLEDLMQQATGQDQPAYLGAGDAIEKNAAYHAWRGIFWDLFELDSAPDAEPPGAGRLSSGQRKLVFDRLQTAVPDKEHLAPLLNVVLPTDLPDNDLTAQMTGEVRAGNIQDLLIALLETKAAGSPLLLIVENAHWLDSASWALTRLVSRDIPKLLLVIATRPLADPLPSEYSALLARTNTEHLALSTLPPGDTLQLVHLRLGVEELPEAVEELLLEKAGGHPFFSEELAYALRDAGLLVVENGTGKLAAGESELAALTFPNSIDSVITSRIDLLAPQQQLTLKVASVIGRVFPYSTLYDIHPVATDRPLLHEQLNTLERLDITPLETPEPDLSYIFKHIITQEVAYNLMSFAQRQGLHQAITEWLERTYSEDLAPYFPLLAYHYQKALGDQYGRSDLVAKTKHYLSQAADRSLNNYANREAINYYSALLRLDDLTGNQADTLSRARWQRGLGEANFRLGDWMTGSEQIELAVALLGHSIPSNKAALGVKLTGQLVKQAYFRLRSPALPSRAQFSQKELAEVLTATDGYRTLSQAYWFRGEPARSIYSAVYNANMAEPLGASAQLLSAIASMVLMWSNIPGQPFADTYLGLVNMIYPEIDDLPSKAWTGLVSGMYLLKMGRWTDGLRMMQEACSFSEELGHKRRWEENRGASAHLLKFWGKFNEAAKRWEEVHASALRRGDAQPQHWALSGLVENALWTDGDTQYLLAILQESADLLAAENIGPGDHLRTNGLLALVFMRQGKYELAQQKAGLVLELMQQSSVQTSSSYDFLVAPVDVYLSLWEMEAERPGSDDKEFSRLARQGLKKSRELGRTYPIFKPRALYYQGRYDWLSGKQRKAQRAWLKGIDLALGLDMPHEAGLLHLEYGRHLPLGDPDRDKHLTRALELFTGVGANYYVNHAREELNNERES